MRPASADGGGHKLLWPSHSPSARFRPASALPQNSRLAGVNWKVSINFAETDDAPAVPPAYGSNPTPSEGASPAHGSSPTPSKRGGNCVFVWLILAARCEIAAKSARCAS